MLLPSLEASVATPAKGSSASCEPWSLQALLSYPSSNYSLGTEKEVGVLLFLKPSIFF